MKTKLNLIFLTVILFQVPTILPAQHLSDATKKLQCDLIVDACRHAWQGYLKDANGYDALMPISKKGKNWYSSSLLMTPVDAFDTFYLLKMKAEADEAKSLVLKISASGRTWKFSFSRFRSAFWAD